MYHKDALFNNKQHTSSKYKIQFELEYLTIKKTITFLCHLTTFPYFCCAKTFYEGGDRPPRIRGADFLYLSGNDIGRYTACTPVYML